MGFINRAVIGDEIVTIGGDTKVDTINVDLQESNDKILKQLRLLNKNMLEATGFGFTLNDVKDDT